MDFQELLEMLDLSEPGEFEYFENFADLVECDQDIPEELLYQLFIDTDRAVVVDLVKSYFKEMADSMPEGADTDIMSLLDNIMKSLIGLLRSDDEEESCLRFAEELDKFIRWYTVESEVVCTSDDGDDEQILPLRDALTLVRVERLETGMYNYDFSGCMDYELDEYIMTFADMVQDDEDEEDYNDYEDED